MKKFDLLEKRQELNANRVRDTRETTGMRITKISVGSVGGFMLWSACSTVPMTSLAHNIVNAVIVVSVLSYLWFSGAIRPRK